MTAASVHEAVEIKGIVGKLDAPIEHFTGEQFKQSNL